MSTTGAIASVPQEASASSADETQSAFASWLARQLGAPAEITQWVAPEGVGHSNETILVDVLTATKERLSLVVRVEAALPAVFPRYDLGLQCACMRGVARRSRVPVPHVRWLESTTNVFG